MKLINFILVSLFLYAQCMVAMDAEHIPLAQDNHPQYLHNIKPITLGFVGGGMCMLISGCIGGIVNPWNPYSGGFVGAGIGCVVGPIITYCTWNRIR
jgi:hypothetical protein